MSTSTLCVSKANNVVVTTYCKTGGTGHQFIPVAVNFPKVNLGQFDHPLINLLYPLINDMAHLQSKRGQRLLTHMLEPKLLI